MSHKMQRHRYTGELWAGTGTHPDLAGLLNSNNVLIEITHGESPYRVVIGVPHQAAVGVIKIAEEVGKGRDSDEAAAMFALAAFASLRERELSCKLLVAAHATDHDPNKKLDSPYFENVITHPARLLFECHGAGEGRSNELELTAGRNGLTRPEEFGRLLAKALRWRVNVATQKHPGERGATVILGQDEEEEGRLELAALDTDSLREVARKGMHALHLEAKPRFRFSGGESNILTEDGKQLGQAIAGAVIEYLDANENR